MFLLSKPIEKKINNNYINTKKMLYYVISLIQEYKCMSLKINNFLMIINSEKT